MITRVLFIGWHSTAQTVRCTSRPPGQSSLARVWLWWHTPTTNATGPLFGSTVRSPLYGVELPVLAHPAAEPDKGTGVAMCCTFGDLTDVTWWRDVAAAGPSDHWSRWSDRARQAGVDDEDEAWDAIAGKTIISARESVVLQLQVSGDLDGEPTPTMRKANLYEKGRQTAGDRVDSPVVYPQWRPRR